MKQNCLYLIFGAFLLICCPGLSIAQPALDPGQPQESPLEQTPLADAGTTAQTATPAKQPAPEEESTRDALDDFSSIIKEEPKRNEHNDQYQLTTIHNLSNLYWKLGMLDLRDEEAIELYLFINDCNLYLKHSHNEFEWNKIKAATRKYLEKNMGLFPNNFEILLPLVVGRYDQGRGEFDIEDESQLDNVKRLDVSPNSGVPVCGTQSEWRSYPKNIVLALISPFTLKSIPVNPELAEMYIKKTAKKYSKIPLQEGFGHYKRVAFLRLKVQIIQYVETIVYQTRLRAVVYGRLDGYEIYADHDKTNLLYAQDLKDRSGRHHRKHHISNAELEAATKHSGLSGTIKSAGVAHDAISGSVSAQTDTSRDLRGTEVNPGGNENMPHSKYPDTGEVITPEAASYNGRSQQ